MKPKLGPQDIAKKKSLVNEKITFSEIRLVSDDGSVIIRTSEALKKAQELNQDLICIAPNSNPPVCKIMDFGKFLYQEKKRKKEQSKKQFVTELKEIQFRPSIGVGDIKVKAKKIQEFLAQGHKVKLIMQMKGREIGMKDFCNGKYQDFVSFLENFEYDLPPKWQGNKVLAILKKSAIL